MKVVQSLQRAVRTNPKLGQLAIKAIPDMRWTVNVQDVGPMVINLRQNRSYWLRDPLMHEKFMLGALQRFIRPGDTIVDAGANIGLYVRFMIQRFGAGKVVAFEPMAQNRALLERNIRLGRCQERVQIVPAALADFDGVDEFQVDDLSSASGTLDTVAHGEACQGRRQYGLPPLTEKVTVARLDTLVERGEIPVPHVIKIDVEGAEERLLRGAVRTLAQHSPKLAIEFHGAEVARGVVRFLLDQGYALFGYLPAGSGRRAYRQIDSNLDWITGQYSLHHCVAARDPQILQTPIAFAQ